ncbi:hypothetical protein MTP99_007363 [Tenebrio molitor]|nr:hypothetical protein MTP99_007363 [Tenebrio molitor]
MKNYRETDRTDRIHHIRHKPYLLRMPIPGLRTEPSSPAATVCESAPPSRDRVNKSNVHSRAYTSFPTRTDQ